jgi:glycosyltransferase involved in cell wall biosynthesis
VFNLKLSLVKYIFLTNIPTPYRTSFYNELAKFNIEFKVFYMRTTETDRDWSIENESLKHKHFIDKGFYRMIGRFHVHFNPSLIYKIYKNKKANIIIGGAWNDLDVLILALMRRLNIIKNTFYFWSEANYMTIGASNDNWLKVLLRKFVYHSSAGYHLSSGKMTELTLEKWGIKVNGFISLPNTIEEEKFLLNKSDVTQRTTNDIPVFLMPVRLLESDKGILNFFNGIGVENVKRAKFFIAGNGPDKHLIEEYIASNSLNEHIKLLGHCSTSDMIKLYRRSNVFVLPSFSDPSPLSLIEAIRMKLPVLISERCGNHFEAAVSGKNAFIFDPLNNKSIKDAFDSILNRRRDWVLMGDFSEQLYNENFSKGLIIKNFVNTLKNTI